MVNYEIFEELLNIKNEKVIDVCKATGIARATFLDWQRGRYSPKSEKLKKIADHFEVPLSYFTDGKLEEEKENEFTSNDLLLARELNKSDKIELIKDIMKIQKDKDIEIIELITKKILEGQK